MTKLETQPQPLAEAKTSEAKTVKQFGSAISTPILDEILERAKSPALHASIEATIRNQGYYQTQVCCPCGRADGCNVKLRFRSSNKDEWTGKWVKTWKEVPQS